MKRMKIAVVVLAVAVVTLAVLLMVTVNGNQKCCKKNVPDREFAFAAKDSACKCGGHHQKGPRHMDPPQRMEEPRQIDEPHRKGAPRNDGSCHDMRRMVNEAALTNIMTRTSVRAYTDKPVDDETITRIIKAGMAAPTAVNKQPWAFCVVKDRKLLKALGDEMKNAKMVSSSAFAIVVCGDMNKTLNGVAKDFWVQDVSAATENILLAANAFGLGAVWTGLYPNTERAGKVSEILSLPSNLIPLNIIPVGYPAENPVPKDKWKPENVIIK